MALRRFGLAINDQINRLRDKAPLVADAFNSIQSGVNDLWKTVNEAVANIQTLTDLKLEQIEIPILIEGYGATVGTGVRAYQQLSFDCNITGWSVIGDAVGSISVDVDAHASSPPPTAPTLPNTTTDKISASAPIVLSAAQTASSGTAGVGTWTIARSKWDVLGFNVTSATTVKRVWIMLTVTRR